MKKNIFNTENGTTIPDYYDGMYLDGYSPAEIVEAAHNSIIKQHMAA